MAVAPLFVLDMSTLKTRLKLEGASAAGALAEIDQAVEEVRLGFYRRLGAARLAVLVALTYVVNPTTNDGYIRMTANNVEISWVRRRLLEIKPTLFLEGSGNALQQWNDEGAFKSTQTKTLADLIRRLDSEIEDGLVLLEGGDLSAPESNVNVATIGPDPTPDLPGASVFPQLRNPPFRGFNPFGYPVRPWS